LLTKVFYWSEYVTLVYEFATRTFTCQYVMKRFSHCSHAPRTMETFCKQLNQNEPLDVGLSKIMNRLS